MKQAPCNGDLFFAPTDGDIICTGIADASSIVPGTVCKILCTAAYATPDVITCATSGWDTELDMATCDATKGGLGPAAQIGLILFVLACLCGGTFLYQKFMKKNEVDSSQPKFAGDVPEWDRERTVGMGKDGFDNLQTLELGSWTPLPHPKNRPEKGYHPAGAGIHDFMGTCTIGTVSQNPKLGDWKEDPKNLA